MSEPPLAIDLFCGLGGWSEGLLAEGWKVIGFDIERHVYGDMKYPAQLVLQDVLTLHGSQFKDVGLIVASPPCQEFSYMAMPWSRAKAIQAEYENGTRDRSKLTALFDACFRIQREACEAAGRHIPLIVENVRGAQKWVGRSRWNYGSFHLWGDVPALMPMTVMRGMKHGEGQSPGRIWSERPSGNVAAHREYSGSKSTGMNRSDQTKRGQDFTRIAGQQVMGNKGVPHKPTGHWTNPLENGTKCGGDWFNSDEPSISRTTSSKSKSRKAASAMIAKIPMPLSRHLARTFK